MTELLRRHPHLAAPRELVFDALTKPEHFAVWFGTARWRCRRTRSRWMSARRRVPRGHAPADGNLIHWAGTYVEVDHPRTWR
jgi:uncharacterized protein YndB with AHSA1/START domain